MQSTHSAVQFSACTAQAVTLQNGVPVLHRMFRADSPFKGDDDSSLLLLPPPPPSSSSSSSSSSSPSRRRDHPSRHPPPHPPARTHPRPSFRRPLHVNQCPRRAKTPTSRVRLEKEETPDDPTRATNRRIASRQSPRDRLRERRLHSFGRSAARGVGSVFSNYNSTTWAKYLRSSYWDDTRG